jgi:hypothetical protein
MVTVVVKASRLKMDTGTYQHGDVIEIEEDVYQTIKSAVSLVKVNPEVPVTVEEIVEAEALADKIVAESAVDEEPVPQMQVQDAIAEAEVEENIARARNGRGKKKPIK